MEQITLPRSPRTLTAIAAVLVLSVTPSLAQEATASQPAPVVTAPEIVAPSVAPSAPATPSAAAPAPAVTSMPVVQNAVPRPEDLGTEPASAAEEPVAAPARSSKARAVEAAKQRGVAASEPKSVQPVVTGDKPAGNLAQGAVPAAAVTPMAPAQASPSVANAPATISAPATASNDTVDLTTAGFAALLAALGVAGAGAIAMSVRRRRRAGDATIEPVSVVPEPAAATPLAQGDPVAPEGIIPLVESPTSVAQPVVARQTASAGQTSGLALLGGGSVPTDPDERSALVERMVAAPPDADNPFTTAKGRRRRARLLLNRRETEMGQQKPFDWRTYRPTTARVEPVTREPMDA